MRTQDLNRFEQLAHRLAFGGAVDEAEVAALLSATGRSREDLEARAEFHRWRKRAAPRPQSALERYQEETKIAGIHEGLVVVGAPILILFAATVALGAFFVALAA